MQRVEQVLIPVGNEGLTVEEACRGWLGWDARGLGCHAQDSDGHPALWTIASEVGSLSSALSRAVDLPISTRP